LGASFQGPQKSPSGFVRLDYGAGAQSFFSLTMRAIF
jgi:hypothetical protein